MTTAKLLLLAMVVFAFLDAVWLGYVMTSKYKEWFGPLARLNADGSFNINFVAAVGVYILLAVAIVFFVLPVVAQGGPAKVFAYGALMGLIVYGVYDLTNAATLIRWPLTLIIADVAWGTIATGLTALVTTNLGKMFHWL
jgi:uncharacterized membrane protein